MYVREQVKDLRLILMENMTATGILHDSNEARVCNVTSPEPNQEVECKPVPMLEVSCKPLPLNILYSERILQDQFCLVEIPIRLFAPLAFSRVALKL